MRPCACARAGRFPDWLSELRALELLDLSRNAFTGRLPAGASDACWSRMRRLQLQRNALTGPVPAGLGTLARLESLNLSHNGLEGGVPDSITLLTKLQVHSACACAYVRERKRAACTMP